MVIKEVQTYDEAVGLLQQDCELCAGTVTYKQMLKMPNCDHKCCSDCATNFFTIVVTDQNISQAVCPFCREPSNLADDDEVEMRKKGFPYFVIFSHRLYLDCSGLLCKVGSDSERYSG